jgi:uncharacterized membrane protein
MGKPQTTVREEHKHDTIPENRLSLERLVFFSDAVFAIAITILVLDIRLPAGAASGNGRELLLSLTGLWQEYLAFFISFWVIGLSWMSHHRKFLFIQRVDNRLLVLNLLMLMMIAFIPFPTAVMSGNVSFTATSFYALTMILASLSSLVLWWHAARDRHLLDPNLDERRIWREATVHLATIAIFILSIGVAALEAGLARICWVLVFPVAYLLRRNA